jgi:AhpD family alkylhydroperoxidase
MSIRLRYPEVAPGGYAALSAFGHYLTTETTLEPVLKALVDLRASQLNGCEFCISLHSAELRKHHEPDSRIEALATWATSDAFTPRERAALRWTELLTILVHHASEEDFAAVSEFFTGKDLADLTYAIANINAWNRLGIAFRPTWNSNHGQPEKQDVLSDDGAKVAED